MTRIIGGAAGGRRIATPRGDATRPTSDRVREALFSAVESWCGSLTGLRVLDLYAGSGAVGLEAFSRGAAAVTLVERDRRTARLIADNVRTLGLAGQFQVGQLQVVSRTVRAVLATPPGTPYDLVFSDPPYPQPTDEVERDLASLVEHDWLASGAMVVVERAARDRPPSWPRGIRASKERRYGETLLCFGHAEPDEGS